jgi:hypothetical protein
MNLFRWILVSLWVAPTLLSAEQRQASSGTFPIEGEIDFELGNDYVAHSDDPGGEINDLYFTMEPYVRFSPTEFLSIDALFIFESVQDPAEGEDPVFDDHGVFVEQLTLRLEQDRYAVFGGKFTPAFGIAWDEAPGIYGADFAEDYEMVERIGVGFSLLLVEDGRFGSHALEASSFFIDTSSLSGSMITSRGRTRLSDGGAGNTEDLSSFAITLGGEDLGGIDELFYHAAYRMQARGDLDVSGSKEEAWVLALGRSIDWNEDWRLTGLAEYAWFAHMDGEDADATYLTSSLLLSFRETWNLAASYTLRSMDEADNRINDSLFQLTAGYVFENGVSIKFGYLRTREDGVSSDTIGLLSTFTLAF